MKMEKHNVKELTEIASELRLAGASLTDIMARLTKVGDELANASLMAEDVDEAKDADEDKSDVLDACDNVQEAKEALMDAAFNLIALVRIYGRN